jgi:hypothetical protein
MTDGAAQRENNLVSRIAMLEAELASVRRAHDHQAQARERAEHEREQYRKLYTLVLFELERLKRQLFGKKAESVDPNRVQLVFDALARAEHGGPDAHNDVQAELAKLRAAAEEANEATAAGATGKTRRGHGRRDFDAERAPVEVIVLEPPERSLPGGEALVKIGEEVSEHFDYRPASVVRVRIVRPKYRKPTERRMAALRSSPLSFPSDPFRARLRVRG